MTGDLTIHGVTRPTVLDVELGGSLKDPWGKHRPGFTATASIDRKEFGITFNQALDHGGVALGEKVDHQHRRRSDAGRGRPGRLAEPA